MNSFNLTLSGKHFICTTILNDSFAGWSNLGCRSLPFMTLNTSFQPPLTCKVSFEKSTDSLMGTLLQVTVSFSLAAFKILSLSLILGKVIMMWFGVCFLESNFFWTLQASWTSWQSLFPLPDQGNSPSLCSHISFQFLTLPLLLLAPL